MKTSAFIALLIREVYVRYQYQCTLSEWLHASDSSMLDSVRIINLHIIVIITGLPTHSVGDQYCFDLWRLLSSSVTLHVGLAGGFTRTSQVMASCCFQLHGNTALRASCVTSY